jgi:hypothetical protein
MPRLMIFCSIQRKLMMPWLLGDVDKQMNITSCVQQCKFKYACKVIYLLIHKEISTDDKVQ